jgi:predicted nucleic acid-binding protein
VVDASVAAKWFVEEEYQAEATRLLGPPFELRAPELLWAEVGHVFRQRVHRKQLTEADLHRALASLVHVWDVRAVSNRLLVGAAGRLAIALAHGIYDCFYLALAERETCRLVTADRRLHDKIAGSPLSGLTRWIEDVP